jgi:hypothetical protein
MTMLYDLAHVIDCGTYYRVTNVVNNTLDAPADHQEKYLKLSYMSAEMMKKAVVENKTIHISKTLRTTEVLPGEFEVIDLMETDPLQEARNAAMIKIRMLITPELSKIAGLTMYGFIMLNNDLANAGYFITNDNREEKYLEILETGDEKLITKLEDYLNYKDEIESVAQLERKFSAFRTAIKLSNTQEEVKTIEQNFLEDFYARF